MISPTNSNPLESLGLRSPQDLRESESQGDDKLGQEDFLKLMITQFQNQDPMDPMKNNKFLGQLAQFSTVSGVNELKDAFGELSGAMQSSQALQASGLVGRTVLAEGDAVRVPAEGGGAQGAVNLENSASDVVVDVVNANGERVRRMHMGPSEAGLARFQWDGLDDDGNAVAPGDYTLRADVVRGGETQAGEVLTSHEVESVTLGQGGQGVTLNTVMGGLSLSDVHEFI
jgi:flagellar basal-body rod modification protein FlgD